METILPFGGGILIGVILLVVSLILVAFFSSSEAALISVNKIRIRHLAEQGNPSAQSVQRIARNPDQLFATILTSENLFIIFATSIGTALAKAAFFPPVSKVNHLAEGSRRPAKAPSETPAFQRSSSNPS